MATPLSLLSTRQTVYDKGGGQYSMRPPPSFANKLGVAMQGIAAPFLGNYNFAAEQQMLQLQQEKADMEFQKYLQEQGVGSIDPLTVMALGNIDPDLAKQYMNRESKSPYYNNIPETEMSVTGISGGKPTIGQSPESKIEQSIYKESASQGSKAAELAGRDVFRATSAIDTTFDAYLGFSDTQFQKFGLKPGQFLGLADKLTPSQWNEYKAGFKGASREAAALVARQLIPGVRAANITEIFAKSTAEIGNTSEGNARNVSLTMQNSFSNSLAQNIIVATEDGKSVPIQSITKDPKTGKIISSLLYKEKTEAINRLKRQYGEELNDYYLKRTFDKNPELLEKKTRNKLIKDAVKFKSEEEANSANLPPFTIVNIGGRIGVIQ